MDSLIGQLIVVTAAVIIVPEIFKNLKINGYMIAIGVFIAVAAIMGR